MVVKGNAKDRGVIFVFSCGLWSPKKKFLYNWAVKKRYRDDDTTKTWQEVDPHNFSDKWKWANRRYPFWYDLKGYCLRRWRHVTDQNVLCGKILICIDSCECPFSISGRADFASFDRHAIISIMVVFCWLQISICIIFGQFFVNRSRPTCPD